MMVARHARWSLLLACDGVPVLSQKGSDVLQPLT